MHCNTRCSLLATQTSTAVTTRCLGYLHSHTTRTMRLSTASPIYLYAHFQRILGVAPSPPLALAEALQHTLLATQTSTAVATSCLGYLRLYSHTRTMRPSTATSPICLCAYFQRMLLGVAPSPLALGTRHGNTRCSRLKPRSAVATTACLGYLHSHTRTMRPSTASPIYLYAYSQRILGVGPSPLAPRPHTATPTARDSNLDSGNQDMSRLSGALSALAYPNDAPIHCLADKPSLLPTDIGWHPGPRTQNRHMQPHSFCHPNALTATKLNTCICCRCQSVSAHPLGHCSRLFSPNTAPALTSECVRWRGCEMHKLGYRTPLQTGDRRCEVVAEYEPPAFRVCKIILTTFGAQPSIHIDQTTKHS
jgi:hypothetical protein